MIDLLDAEQVWEARELAYSLRPLVHAVMGGGQGTVMAKYALWIQGVIAAPTVRLPLVGPEEEELERLRKVLGDMSLL